MDVEEAYASAKLQRVRYGQFWTPVHSFLEVDSILAHNIIHDQCNRNVFHVVGQSHAEAIVHVDLPDEGYKYYPACNWCIDRTYLSPFWKSTTDVGTKNP